MKTKAFIKKGFIVAAAAVLAMIAAGTLPASSANAAAKAQKVKVISKIDGTSYKYNTKSGRVKSIGGKKVTYKNGKLKKFDYLTYSYNKKGKLSKIASQVLNLV